MEEENKVETPVEESIPEVSTDEQEAGGTDAPAVEETPAE